MYLSKFTDYSYRILVYLAKNKNTIVTMEEVSNELKIPINHTKKIIWELGKNKIIETTRGRRGGIYLALNPNKVNLKEVFMITEKNLNISECFQEETNCPYEKTNCKIKNVISNALNEFINEFSKYTLADLI